MAGIYLHVPFCRRACSYCDFHFTTSLRGAEAMVGAMCREMELRGGFLGGAMVETVYLGGGTPSLLPMVGLERLLGGLRRLHRVADGAEVTLEANPEDITPERLREWKGLGINRLSIGVQSFVDAELRWMNRGHAAMDSARCIALAQEAGITDISIDLIFGLPGQPLGDWEHSVSEAIATGVPHISAYCLTVEERTPLSHGIAKGTQERPDDGHAEACYRMAVGLLGDAGFEHYEVSSHALPGHRSRHNSSYWMGVPYLGIGPSAHSYDGAGRQWNERSNAAYIQRIGRGQTVYEHERLSMADRVNEHLMTGLRSAYGVRQHFLDSLRPGEFERVREALLHLPTSHYALAEGSARLTSEGWLRADAVAAGLFVED